MAWQIPGSRGAPGELLTGPLSRFAEYPGDSLPRPAHPFGREVPMLAWSAPPTPTPTANRTRPARQANLAFGGIAWSVRLADSRV